MLFFIGFATGLAATLISIAIALYERYTDYRKHVSQYNNDRKRDIGCNPSYSISEVMMRKDELARSVEKLYEYGAHIFKAKTK